MNNIQSVCVIPARGGSKRIPRKNIVDFCGKPLIAYSIEAALSSNLFDDVYVSTDDAEIAEIAINYGASVPFIRPGKFSDDFSTDKDVRRHFIDWLKSSNLNPDVLCYLYATAPFCTPNILHTCFELLVRENVSQVHTITTFSYPIKRALSKDKNGYLSFVWEENSNKRSQDFEEYYHDAGLCYFFDLHKYDQEYDRLGVLLPRYQCQDIDTPEDLDLALMLYSSMHIKHRNFVE